MPQPSTFPVRRELLLLAAAIVLAVGGAIFFYLTRATVLTVAVAPRDGTEPALLHAYADALARRKADIRLKIVEFADVKDSGLALQDGRADLAVVRPDVMVPTNGLTLMILRDQAMMIVSPESAGITSFAALSGKRLGIAAQRDADIGMLKTILDYYSLTLQTEPAATTKSGDVHLIAIEEAQAAEAIRDKRIDAFLSIIAPSAPKAVALVEQIKATGRGGKVAFVQVEDDDAVIERFPQLQSVTIPAGLFGGRPKLPEADVKTVGASYRLMARASLSRTLAADLTQSLFELRSSAGQATDAANYVKAPDYETTVAATSAQIPIHPGALDYYERDQHSFIDRYGDTLYLLGALLGGLVSAGAWLRERLIRLRRERIDEIIDRLLEIIRQARELREAEAIGKLNAEIDDLATDVVRYIREREPDTSMLAAVSIAIETARATVLDRSTALAQGGKTSSKVATRLTGTE